MKKFFVSAVLVITGCDDAFVAENIDVLTCSLLPPWVADCTSDEVHGKALDMLQFGLVEAKVTCASVPFHAPDDCGPSETDATYVAHRLADGSAFITLDEQTFLLGRVEAAAGTLSVVHPRQAHDTWYVSEGQLFVHKEGCADIVVDIETECTGYNLDALSR